MPSTKFIFSGRKIQAIYNPTAAKLLKPLGCVLIHRASNVEAGSSLSLAARQHLQDTSRWSDDSDNQWFADLTPTTTETVVLGPFTTNTEALSAEVAFLQEHMREYSTNQR